MPEQETEIDSEYEELENEENQGDSNVRNEIDRRPDEESGINVIQKKKRTRKRNLDPKSWKLNINKNKRFKGEEYVGHKNKVKSKKELEEPCNYCRLKCYEKFTENKRLF